MLVKGGSAIQITYEICAHDVDGLSSWNYITVYFSFQNVRLLSQFVSPYTGQIYGRHITGLCIYMQKRVAKLIRRSRYFGKYMYLEVWFIFTGLVKGCPREIQTL